ncbi:hypothetical protein AGMMS50212_15270 [Spirochaetia bacterium]|nr:hypothetical protein AGMMS50212_15270 [Spirochaetia bacterium]
MKKITFSLIILNVSFAAFSQQGFFIQGGLGGGMNSFKIEEVTSLAGNPGKINGNFQISQFSVDLEFGFFFIRYFGIGLDVNYNFATNAKTDYDEISKAHNPSAAFLLKGSFPISDRFGIGLDVGVVGAYYKVDVNNQNLKIKHTTDAKPERDYVIHGLEGYSIGLLIRPNVSIQPVVKNSGRGFFINLSCDIGIWGLGFGDSLSVAAENPLDSRDFFVNYKRNITSGLYFKPALKIGYNFDYGPAY